MPTIRIHELHTCIWTGRRRNLIWKRTLITKPALRVQRVAYAPSSISSQVLFVFSLLQNNVGITTRAPAFESARAQKSEKVQNSAKSMASNIRCDSTAPRAILLSDGSHYGMDVCACAPPLVKMRIRIIIATRKAAFLISAEARIITWNFASLGSSFPFFTPLRILLWSYIWQKFTIHRIISNY